MTSTITITVKFDNFDAIIAKERQRLGKLVASTARKAALMMAAKAPRSDVNSPGYIHFADKFEAQQVAPFVWSIVNDKMVGTNGEYPLWKLLEYGTRYMSPRRTIGPVMDIIGPEFLREAGRFER
jgi:hypothetical protein